MPEARNALPEASNALPEARNALPEARNALPEARNALPEAASLTPEWSQLSDSFASAGPNDDSVPTSPPPSSEKMTYLDIHFLDFEEIKNTSPNLLSKPLTFHIAAYRLNTFFGKDKPFVEYAVSSDGSLPIFQYSPNEASVDEETTIGNGCFEVIRRMVAVSGVSEEDFMGSAAGFQDYFRGFWKFDDKDDLFVFLNWTDLPMNTANDKWKSISEIVHLSTTSDDKGLLAELFDKVPRIKHLFRPDYSRVPQPVFLYGPAILLRTMDDRFGNFFVFIEPTKPSSDYPSKYLVSLPDEKDIFFIIRDPLIKIESEVLDSQAERFRASQACMYYEEHRNVWIIKNAATIYNIDNLTTEQIESAKQFSSLSNRSLRSSEAEKGSIASSIIQLFQK